LSARLRGDHLIILLRAEHANMGGLSHRGLHGVVGEDVELLLIFALHVGVPRPAKHAQHPGAAHIAGDDLGRATYVGEQTGKVDVFVSESLERCTVRTSHQSLSSHEWGCPCWTTK